MTIVKMREIQRLKKYKRRFENMATEEIEIARNLYDVGSLDFMGELQAYNQHLGAIKALEYILYKIDPGKVLTDKEKQYIVDGIIQRGIGVSICCVSIISTVALNALFGVIPLFAVIPGGALILSNKRIIIKHK